jgi:hypothetical protein
MTDTFHALHQLVRDAVGFDDEVNMWVFGRRPLELQPWTNKDFMLARRYNIPDAAGAPIFETLSLVSKNMDKAKHVRRILIGVTGGTTSDGWRRQAGPAFAPPLGRPEPPSLANRTGNPWSPSEERERALKDLKSQDVMFYAIGLETPRPSEQKVEPPPPIDMNELRVASEFTGGYVAQVKSTDDLPRALGLSGARARGAAGAVFDRLYVLARPGRQAARGEGEREEPGTSRPRPPVLHREEALTRRDTCADLGHIQWGHVAKSFGRAPRRDAAAAWSSAGLSGAGDGDGLAERARVDAALR